MSFLYSFPPSLSFYAFFPVIHKFHIIAGIFPPILHQPDSRSVFFAGFLGNKVVNNVEMMNLMCIFNHSDRKVLAEDISASLPYIDDQDMAELMKQTVLLLEEMSEEDFSELVFVPAEEEDEPDWEGLI